ncbi:hypothetical protein BT63DRAFT_49631 [Microthyrium microscopicum]|uniref:DUF6594 domain-containing protein n=1 Tax=Microthyrium microscopicum TaxID=703497 RepID=A0A6A6U350_9PEZI|nr:hypothetical protein BT63DRAFT_49631 [Microthyrium microscopicum]
MPGITKSQAVLLSYDRLPEGAPQVAHLTSLDPHLNISRSYAFLRRLDLIYWQQELAELENRFKKVGLSGESLQTDKVVSSQGDITELRDKMREYRLALINDSLVESLPTPAYRDILTSADMLEIGYDRKEKQIHLDRHDLVSLTPCPDHAIATVSNLVASIALKMEYVSENLLLGPLVERINPGPGKRPRKTIYAYGRWVNYMSRLIVAGTITTAIVGPVLILAKLPSPGWRLAVCGISAAFYPLFFSAIIRPKTSELVFISAR